MVTVEGRVIFINRGQCGQCFWVLPTLPTLEFRAPHKHGHRAVTQTAHVPHIQTKCKRKQTQTHAAKQELPTCTLSSAPDRCPLMLNKSSLPLCLIPTPFCCSLIVEFPPNKNAHPPMTPANWLFMVPRQTDLKLTYIQKDVKGDNAFSPSDENQDISVLFSKLVVFHVFLFYDW